MREFERAIRNIKGLDVKSMEEARIRQDTLTKPKGSLGRLEELSIRLAGIMRTSHPEINNKVIITMAGDHGVVEEGVTLYPQEVTVQMVNNFLRGGAAVNVLADHVGARVIVVDMGVSGKLDDHLSSPVGTELIIKKVGKGTRNMALGPAMSREEAFRSLEAGIEVVDEQVSRGMDILGIGDMGIGNTTASSAIASLFTGLNPIEVTGRGTGLDNGKLSHKINIIDKALKINKPDPHDAVDVLAKVGGFEIGGMAGAVIAAAAHRIPVVLDGFISGAAALIAVGIEPEVRNYLIASHQSVEAGHIHVLNYLKLKPLLNLNMRLGEGTGAALGISLAQAAASVLNKMATFSQAGVSEA